MPCLMTVPNMCFLRIPLRSWVRKYMVGVVFEVGLVVEMWLKA